MSDSEEETGFRINTSYAKSYDKWREKEELQKLKDKYGDVENMEDEESSSETEDEDAEELTDAVEKDWFRALAAIKSKNPKIYNQKTKFFGEDPGEGTSSRKKDKDETEKPMFLKDYDRKVILEKGGVINEEDDDYSSDDDFSKKRDPSYFEEQDAIRRSFKEAEPDSDSEEEFLTARKKSEKQQAKEETEYFEWLKGQKDDLTIEKQVGIELDPLKKYWSNPSLDEGEKFLRDYILNKQYVEEKSSRIPTYNEIVDEDLSDEEKELEKQEDFERKYNFRFEEPDPEFIKTYPRTIGDSVRRKEDKRTQKRHETKDRKKLEKEKKMEELKQLKNLKKREIMSKLDKLKEITGNPDLAFSEVDMEGDFDPQEHDKLMKHVFSEDYYDDEDELKKPEFFDDEDLGLEDDNWDKWKGSVHDAGNQERVDGEDQDDSEANFNMDADYDANCEDRSFGLDGRSKKQKRKSKFAQAVERKKPVFNPDQNSFEEYFEEYYKLDYEDVIGDQPCRFKYRSVMSNDYGLSAEEVLSCQDKELNAWVSLKRMSQYRTEEEEDYDKLAYHRKSRNLKKKLNILLSLNKSEEDEESMEVHQKKRKRKRKQKAETIQNSVTPSSSADLCDERKTSSLDTNDSPSKKQKQFTTDEVIQNDKTMKHKKVKIPKSVAKHKGNLSKNALKNKNKKLKKRKGNKLSEEPGKDKKKKKKGRTREGFVGGKGFEISEERLKAYGLDPRKFKYTHTQKLNSGD